MELVRVIKPRDCWSEGRKRFSNVVFKRSSGDVAGTPDSKAGISVFELECACGDPVSDGCVCSHVVEFYSELVSGPAVYWRFAFADVLAHTTDLPTQPVVVEETSSGDQCHRNIHHLAPVQSRRVFNEIVKDAPQEHLRICDGKDRPFSEEAIAEIMA